jgi:hypothetical protein
MKLLALLHAAGKDGRDALQSLGFDLDDATATYEQAMDHLRTVYGTEETIYVRTMKFVTVGQASGENENEYLLRVEKLSRNMNFGGNNDDLRQQMALALAVNGLRDSAVRKQLMQQADLNWNGLVDALRARRLARESESILEGAKAGMFNVKKEVAVIGTRASIAKRHPSSSDDDDREVSRTSTRRTSRYDKNKSTGRSDRTRRDRSLSSTGSSGDRYVPDWRKRGGDEYEKRRSSPSRFASPKGGSKYDKRRPSPKRYTSPTRDNKCFGCGQTGHQVRFCPRVRCYVCNERGHTSKDCPTRRERYSRDNRKNSGSDSGRSGGSRSPSTRVRFSESSSRS